MSRGAVFILMLTAAVPALAALEPAPVPALVSTVGPVQPRISVDVDALPRLRIGTEPAALLELLHNHRRTDVDAARLEEWIQRLGDEDYDRREKATRAILALGRPALPRLAKARDDDDLEVRRRA